MFKCSCAWNPLPENKQANLIGDWCDSDDELGDACALLDLSAGSDSSHGRAMLTPTPRSIVRRDNRRTFLAYVCVMSWPRYRARIGAANVLELFAQDDIQHGAGNPRVAMLEADCHLLQ